MHGSNLVGHGLEHSPGSSDGDPRTQAKSQDLAQWPRALEQQVRILDESLEVSRHPEVVGRAEGITNILHNRAE